MKKTHVLQEIRQMRLKDVYEKRAHKRLTVEQAADLLGVHALTQYLPKEMALDKVTDEDIILIQDKLNNRPRKLLGYKTPNEVYDAMRLTA